MSSSTRYFLLGIGSLLGTLIIPSSSAPPQLSEAIIPKKDISALINHPVTISCLSPDDSPLNSCRWERRPPVDGTRYFVNIRQTTPNNASQSLVDNPPGFDCNCTYEYAGTGLENGDCSITIRNVSQFHVAKWDCLLSGIKGDTWLASLNVTEQADSPYTHKPYFEGEELHNGIIYDENSTTPTNVTCCSRSHPTSSIYLEIFRKNGSDIYPMFRETQNDTLYLRQERTCRSTIFRFLPEHNGQYLVCNASFYQNSRRHELTEVIPIVVKSGPIFVDDSFSQALTSNNSLELNVTFSANPCPNMTWYLFTDGDNTNFMEIRPNHTKYSTSLHHLYRDKYTASLQILQVVKEDYRREFKLSLGNPLGSKEIHVKIADGGEGEGGGSGSFWIMMLLVLLGAVILFVFIFTVICVVIRRRRDRKGKYTPPQQVTYVTRSDAPAIEIIDN